MKTTTEHFEPDKTLTCYVITYNRPLLLEETLNSIVQSNFKGFRLVVIDNGGSEPEKVKHVVTSINRYFPTELIRFPINESGIQSPFFFAATESSSDFLMIFHDDDLVHPDYIGRAVKELESNDRCSFVCSYGKPVENPVYNDFEKLNFSHKKKVISGPQSLAHHCITVNHGIFGSTIYRRTKLRNLNPETLARFGKIGDRPLWFKCLDDGVAIFFQDQYILYRVHAGQDTETGKTGPFPNECIALLAFYRSILGDSITHPSGRAFAFNQSSFLRQMWKWPGIRSRVNYIKFILNAYKQGAATIPIFLPRFFTRFLTRRTNP
jgi:glycosyltransferase involved in cell wall biosynthesis